MKDIMAKEDLENELLNEKIDDGERWKKEGTGKGLSIMYQGRKKNNNKRKK